MSSFKNIASQWFQAAEAAGDFMGIRYGRVQNGSKEVDWSFVSHCECDGIGGFVRLLRERGAKVETLPETMNPCREIVGPLWGMWRRMNEESKCAKREDWKLSDEPRTGPPEAVAWHLFTEEKTKQIREHCRLEKVTVNSFLLKHLDQAIRPEIGKSQARIPWMIPVNLRGDVKHADDTENHVSCVEPQIAVDDSPQKIQHEIYRRLQQGEHRANYLALEIGRFLSHATKVKFIMKDRAKPQGNIGAFSNLGVWDSGKAIETNDSWLFCPPVVGGQLLGAGCVTFQNRLSLTIQTHTHVATAPEIAETWVKRWVNSISSLSP
jgi:hypothetical protein